MTSIHWLILLTFTSILTLMMLHNRKIVKFTEEVFVTDSEYYFV